MKIVPHLKLSDDLGISYAILPGDPARVGRIAKHLDQVENLSYNREFKSIKGMYKGVPILVTSTGLGGPSTGLAVEELAQIGIKHAIRIGSCGALQSNIRIGDLILVQGAVRDEGTTAAYLEPTYPAVSDFHLLTTCVKAADTNAYTNHIGIVRSHDSLYTEKKKIADDYYAGRKVLGSDMETAALLIVGGLRGIHTASILNCVVEYGEKLEENINQYVNGEKAAMVGEEHEIITALEACYFTETESHKN